MTAQLETSAVSVTVSVVQVIKPDELSVMTAQLETSAMSVTVSVVQVIKPG